MANNRQSVELAWFAALCDDDYEFLGVADEDLQSSWLHCSDIVRRAETNGFDNVLLPSGYSLGIDSTAFAGAVATLTNEINLLLAVRLGELVVPQLARQIATLQQISNSRLVINAISSEMPGEQLSSEARYRRTTEYLYVLGELLEGREVNIEGEFLQLHIDPPRITGQGYGCPPIYFGGLSEAARDCAAASADVYLMWPDTTAKVSSVVLDLTHRAQNFGRKISFGWRSHVIVRETEREAREAARKLLSRLDSATGDAIRAKSLDATSTGVNRQSELRSAADDEGYLEQNLWTGVGRARSGAGIAIVGDPDQVTAKLNELADAGVSAFILSGYPHLKECDLFARYVLPQINHAPLSLTHAPAVLHDHR
ncbi:MAG: LLM class flavin-dependent oxidoreductase [Actinomycetota bacterium]|nr:LLM class flavin-dependent oxidoreductase [Actinomycetota bacterium]